MPRKRDLTIQEQIAKVRKAQEALQKKMNAPVTETRKAQLRKQQEWTNRIIQRNKKKK